MICVPLIPFSRKWLWSRVRLCSALSPCPGRDAPPVVELAKRHCKGRAGLGDPLAVYFDCHRRGDDDIRAIAGDVDVSGLAQRHEITGSAFMLTGNHRVSVPI